VSDQNLIGYLDHQMSRAMSEPEGRQAVNPQQALFQWRANRSIAHRADSRTPFGLKFQTNAPVAAISKYDSQLIDSILLFSMMLIRRLF
jgi:hypothetical protein